MSNDKVKEIFTTNIKYNELKTIFLLNGVFDPHMYIALLKASEYF